MNDIKQLGASWENDSLYFVESSTTNPEKMFTIPFQPRSQTSTKKDTLDVWESELVEKIKNTFKEQKVHSSTVNLSLPTSDIIFRSFVIPWMQHHEVKNVVEFEICKYIPFSLEELSYSYHPITIQGDGTRQIRIIFVAIKNNALASYVKVLEAASLNVDVIEPSALSLIRTLSFKKLVPEDQTIALIEKGSVGKIIVSDKNTPQFVREFHLSTETTEQDSNDQESIARNLTKEVRISLDYFNRQNEQSKVEKIFFLSSSEGDDLPKNLEDHLGIPVTIIENSSILGDASPPGVGALNAYGASIIPFVSSLASFNLSKNKPETSEVSASSKKIGNRQLLRLTALVCMPFIIGSIFIPMLRIREVKKEIAILNKKLGSFQDADVSFIVQKEELLKGKLENLQQTRTKSDAALFLLFIPDLLPDGTWLKTLDISYYEANPTLVTTIDGYAFSTNKGEQFRLVNTLLRNFKNSTEFSKFFQNIELEITRTQKLGEHDVTYFKIVCKQTNENI